MEACLQPVINYLVLLYGLHIMFVSYDPSGHVDYRDLIGLKCIQSFRVSLFFYYIKIVVPTLRFHESLRGSWRSL